MNLNLDLHGFKYFWTVLFLPDRSTCCHLPPHKRLNFLWFLLTDHINSQDYVCVWNGLLSSANHLNTWLHFSLFCGSCMCVSHIPSKLWAVTIGMCLCVQVPVAARRNDLIPWNWNYGYFWAIQHVSKEPNMVPLEKQYGLLASPNAYFKGHKRGVKDLCKKKSVKFSSMRVCFPGTRVHHPPSTRMCSQLRGFPNPTSLVFLWGLCYANITVVLVTDSISIFIPLGKRDWLGNKVPDFWLWLSLFGYPADQLELRCQELSAFQKCSWYLGYPKSLRSSVPETKKIVQNVKNKFKL